MKGEEALYTLGRVVAAYKDNARGSLWEMHHFPDDCRLDDGMTPDVSRFVVAGILREHILMCYAEHFDGNANFIITYGRINARRDHEWMWEIQSYHGISLADGDFKPFEGLIYESALVAALQAFVVLRSDK